MSEVKIYLYSDDGNIVIVMAKSKEQSKEALIEHGYDESTIIGFSYLEYYYIKDRDVLHIGL